ncbi:MAG: hypothetical protein Q9175_008142 [Cornicularia normoerica]
MHTTTTLSLALFVLATRACSPCAHPGNFTGPVTLLADPAAAYCNAGSQSANYASVPYHFFNPRDEAPCDAPINVTNPNTNKMIQAIVIGNCSTCTGSDLQLTTAALAALSPTASERRLIDRLHLHRWQGEQSAYNGRVDFCRLELEPHRADLEEEHKNTRVVARASDLPCGLRGRAQTYEIDDSGQ